MNVPKFSFKNEAYWMLIFELAVIVLSVLGLLIALFLRWAGVVPA